jgi:hypothetical protein
LEARMIWMLLEAVVVAVNKKEVISRVCYSRIFFALKRRSAQFVALVTAPPSPPVSLLLSSHNC